MNRISNINFAELLKKMNGKVLFVFALLILLVYVSIAEFTLGKFFLENGAFDGLDVFFDSDPLIRSVDSTNALRTKLNFRHPILLIIVYLIVKLSQFFFELPLTERVILLNIIIGSLSVFQFYIFLTWIFKNRLISFAMSLLFLFNFSNVLFSIVPDAFVLAQASIGLMFVVFYLCYVELRWTGLRRFILVLFTGVLVAGSTLTNAATFFIALLVFEYRDKSSTFKKSSINIFLTALFLIGIILVLYPVQFNVASLLCPSCRESSFVFSSSPHATKLLNHVAEYTVSNKIEFERQFYGLASSIKNMFIPTLPIRDATSQFSFNATNAGIENLKNFSFTFFIAAVIALGGKWKNDSLWLSLLFSLAFNLVFHVFFGRDFFLYTQHFAFQLFVLFAFGVFESYKRFPIQVIAGLISLFIVELISTEVVLRYLSSSF